MIKQALSFDDVLLTPQYSTIISRADVSLVPRPLCGHYFNNPIISANMATVTEKSMAEAMDKHCGLGVIHRMQSIDEQVAMIDSLINLGVSAFSVGIKSGEFSRAIESFDAGGDICFLDIAHADSEMGLQFVKDWFKDDFLKDKKLVIGNIATARAITRYLTIIPDPSKVAFKVGIGGGSMCTTRIQTGSGLPTFQSIMDCHEYFPNRDFSLIADGGMKNSGDIVKALAAGADYVMLGSLLAGTTETPGKVILGKDKKKYKIYRGSASYADKEHRGEESRNLEGAETLVEYKGSVHDVLSRLFDGIRSGCSYNGAQSVRDLPLHAEFVQISSQGFKESGAHGE